MVIIFEEEINRFFKANEDFYTKIIIIIMVLILCTGILYFWYREYKSGKITNNIIKSIYERGNYILFNETNDNFRDEVNDITLFEGIIDFDI